MKTFDVLGRVGRILGLVGAFGLAGCASQHAVRVVSAPPIGVRAEVAVVESSARAQPEQAESAGIAIGPLSNANIAMLDAVRDIDLEAGGFQLTPHVSASLPFHCSTGEESFGCAAKPVAAPEQVEEQGAEPVGVASSSRRPSSEGEGP